MSRFVFHPNLPKNYNVNPIAYITRSAIEPTQAVSIFSNERYVIQNSAGLYTLEYSPDAVTVLNASASGSFSGCDFAGLLGAKVGGFSIPSQPLKVLNNKVQFTTLNSPILINKVVKLKSNAFGLQINSGIVWRMHTVSAEEPSWSWLKRSGLETGDRVILGYSVPEVTYNSTNTAPSGSLFWDDQTRLVERTEVVRPTTKTTIKYYSDIEFITEIIVNGVSLFTGKLAPEHSNAVVASFDTEAKIVRLNKSLDVQDSVIIRFLTYADNYLYTGYKGFDSNGDIKWYSCDLNPEYGHIVEDQRTAETYPSSVALLKQVLIYLIPSCYIKLDFTESGSGDIQGSLQFESAFNYEETHFVRHYVGETNEIFDENLGVSSEAFLNYWGITPFNQASYDELGSVNFTDDVFSNFLPSLMPLGKVLLSGPSSSKDIQIIDARQLGGGLPEQDLAKIEKETNGLDHLEGYWDLSTWDGGSRQTGGVVKWQILSEVLDNFTEEEVKKIVELHSIPGTDFEIEYVTEVSP